LRPRKFQRIQQPTPSELTDSCLEILRAKFYTEPGDSVCFQKDRKRLLSWVVLWPAQWLNSKGVTISGDRYREIFVTVFIEAAAHVQSKVKYRPAYLAHVIQSHFKIHGEDYYDNAKATRNVIEQTMVAIAASKPAAPDPVQEMASARQILCAGTPKKSPSKRPVKSQLTFGL
jgi:hypothetical protein